jgi:hypothetical protein
MKTDWITKILLLLIAVALWMNALNPWLKPMPVQAQSDTVRILSSIDANVNAIHTYILGIAGGSCSNSKICR